MLHCLLSLAKVFSLIEDFALEQNTCVSPKFAYSSLDGVIYGKLWNTLIIIQPRGYGESYGNHQRPESSGSF